MEKIIFKNIFHTESSKRDKFLSRLFGIFSEEIVRLWCQEQKSHYRDLGRPTIRNNYEDRGSQLDFTFQSKDNGNIYIVEMKCELEYENYRYLILDDVKQIDHHKKEKPAFEKFLEVAEKHNRYIITTGSKSKADKKKRDITGALLIWGSVTENGRGKVKETFNLSDVLSVEEMMKDMIAWNSKSYRALIEEKKRWCRELFTIINGE